MGYHMAGFEVIGIDNEPQPNYPFTFYQLDVRTLTAERIIARAQAVAASPPCQDASETKRINGREYPKLIAPTRELLIDTGLPWIIENVVGAELKDPVMLCGAMFGLQTYRHRLFESNVALKVPADPPHVARQAKMGRRPAPNEYIHVIGHYSGATVAKVAMGIDWMTRDEMSEAIPPAYTLHLGRQLLAAL